MKRAALYVRVSTDRQTVENQVARLTEIANARKWQIVETFGDAGISGARGRKDRPGLDEMLKQAQRHRFDVVMVWAIDRRRASIRPKRLRLHGLCCQEPHFLYPQLVQNPRTRSPRRFRHLSSQGRSR